jgi:molybdate transport system ATP-binding protein
MTVADHLSYALEIRKAARKTIRARIGELADLLGITHLLHRRPKALSGGERQRVALGRALCAGPDLLLLDEPLASVDRPLRARIVAFLAKLPAATGVPMLLVSHDPDEVVALAQHVVVLERGAVVAQGAPADVLRSAEALDTLAALGAENLFPVAVVAREGGVLRLATPGGCELEMAAPADGGPPPARVAVRAEDVLLAAEAPRAVSAQNVLQGAIAALEPLGEQVVVRVTVADERWTARLTRRAVERLELRVGTTVWLLVKAHAVHGWEPAGE